MSQLSRTSQEPQMERNSVGRITHFIADFSRLNDRIIEAAFYLFYFGVAVRVLIFFSGHKFQKVVFLLFLVFLFLSLTRSFVTKRMPWYPSAYFSIQTALVAVIFLLPPHHDVVSVLYIAMSFQTIRLFSLRKGFMWIFVFIFVMVAMLGYIDGKESIPSLFTYISGCLCIGFYGLAIRNAESTNKRNEALLAELQDAYQKLQTYADRVEELATVEERNRLARDLHDSVTQKIFSLTLTAETALMLLEKEPDRAANMLGRVQTLAQDALSDMRSLIEDLRPRTAAENGLLPALEKHIAQRKDRDGLHVQLSLEGEATMPGSTEEALFGIVQEALNNVVKHSGVDSAEVSLRMTDSSVRLSIRDDGCGFNLREVEKDPQRLGLVGMKDRAELVGGSLSIESAPGAGTCLTIEIPQLKEDS